MISFCYFYIFFSGIHIFPVLAFRVMLSIRRLFVNCLICEAIFVSFLYPIIQYVLTKLQIMSCILVAILTIISGYPFKMWKGKCGCFPVFYLLNTETSLISHTKIRCGFLILAHEGGSNLAGLYLYPSPSLFYLT